MNSETLTVDFQSVQAHYDLSDEFFKLYLDPTMTYPCAYIPTGKETLEEAQIAKIDLSLAKLNLQPGERLLDIGCGWRSTARRARENSGAGNLERSRDHAIQITNEDTYSMYMKYLTSCTDHFRSGDINVYQFLMRAV